MDLRAVVDVDRYAESPEEVRAEWQEMFQMLREKPELPPGVDPAEVARLKERLKVQLGPVVERLLELDPDAFGGAG